MESYPIKIPLDAANSIFLVISKGTYNFEEMLEEIKKAKEFVLISTYNLSSTDPIESLNIDDDELLSILKESKANDKRLVSHIPGWMRAYYGKLESLKEKANKSISTYTELFNEEKDVLHYIMIKNHSKIILTESLGYVGSANFSIQSKNNIEMGVFFTDKFIIRKIWTELIKMFEQESVLAQKAKSLFGESPDIWLEFFEDYAFKLDNYKKILENYRNNKIDAESLIRESKTTAGELTILGRRLHIYMVDYGHFFSELEGDSDRKGDYTGTKARSYEVEVSDKLGEMSKLDDFLLNLLGYDYIKDYEETIDSLIGSISTLLISVNMEKEVLKKHIFQNSSLDNTGVDKPKIEG